MLMPIQTTVAFIIHSVISKQKNTQQGREENNSQQDSEVINNDHRQETVNAPKENGTAQQKSKVIKTRYGQTVKKPDRLIYISHMAKCISSPK